MNNNTLLTSWDCGADKARTHTRRVFGAKRTGAVSVIVGNTGGCFEAISLKTIISFMNLHQTHGMEVQGWLRHRWPCLQATGSVIRETGEHMSWAETRHHVL